jgi:hypothetical protein
MTLLVEVSPNPPQNDPDWDNRVHQFENELLPLRDQLYRAARTGATR